MGHERRNGAAGEDAMIKAQDIVYVAHRAPDLDLHAQFLRDFGMVEAARTADRLYMRGAGTYPFIHVTELGAPGFAGLGMLAGSAADLDLASRLPGASAVEEIEGPGGG